MMTAHVPKRIALVFGTRPEAIKLAPLYLELVRQSSRFRPEVWVTAQHREMLDQVLKTFEITPHRDFDLMRPGQTLTRVTIDVLENLELTFAEDRPDMVLVQGDTTTVFATALAAFYARVPVGHVEAGLRTWNRWSPFPEEINRQLASRLTDLHFAPTPNARDNLLAEQVPADQIIVTGNTVIDALGIVSKIVQENPPEMPANYPVKRLADGRRMVLITGHRRENFGAGFENICRAIATLADRYQDVEWVYPVHLNPNVREPVYRALRGRENISLIDPLTYRPFVYAMNRCHFLLSDSGGVQEEAPHLGKPVLVMRETTERPEALEAGTSRLVGTDAEKIIAEATWLLEEPDAYKAMSRASNPFGDGKACQRIVKRLKEYFAE